MEIDDTHRICKPIGTSILTYPSAKLSISCLLIEAKFLMTVSTSSGKSRSEQDRCMENAAKTW